MKDLTVDDHGAKSVNTSAEEQDRFLNNSALGTGLHHNKSALDARAGADCSINAQLRQSRGGGAFLRVQFGTGEERGVALCHADVNRPAYDPDGRAGTTA